MGRDRWVSSKALGAHPNPPHGWWINNLFQSPRPHRVSEMGKMHRCAASVLWLWLEIGLTTVCSWISDSGSGTAESCYRSTMTKRDQ